MIGSANASPVARGRRKPRFLAATAVVLAILVATVAQSAPAQAAFGPNLIVNGSFEDPVALGGPVAAPFGTCGASVPLSGGTDPLTLVFTASFLGSSSEGCWSLVATGLGTTPTYVDRSLAKGGKQSVHVQSQPSNFALLSQAVPAGPGTYRLQFKATQDPGFSPMNVIVWSVAAGAVNQTSALKFGPTMTLVDGAIQQTWTSYKLDITAPAGTDHLVVCLCTVEAQAVGGFMSRIDAVTLKQQL